MKRGLTIMVRVAMLCLGAMVLAAQTGCGLKVKNTEGIEACLNDVAEAEMRALKVKRRWDPGSEPYRTAEDLYDDAAVKVRQFLNGVHSDASLRHVVNVPSDRYTAHPAAGALRGFLDKTKPPLGVVEGADAVSAELVRGFISGTIEGIGDLHLKRLEFALGQLRELLSRGEMIDFAGLTSERLEAKYTRAAAGVPKP